MIDSISNRAASGHSAYKTSAELITSVRTASESEAGTRDLRPEGPAVIKTISSSEGNNLQAEWDAHLAGTPHARRQGQVGEERAKLAESFFAAVQTRAALEKELDPILRGKENLAENERKHSRLQGLEPVPARELAGEEKSTVLKLMNQLGVRRGGDSTTFIHEETGTRYVVHRDGKILASGADVPTNKEEKSRWLESLNKQIADGKRDASTMIVDRDELTAQIDALKTEIYKGR